MTFGGMVWHVFILLRRTFWQNTPAGGLMATSQSVWLAGGFNYFSFLPIPEEMIQFDEHMFKWVGSTTSWKGQRDGNEEKGRDDWGRGRYAFFLCFLREVSCEVCWDICKTKTLIKIRTGDRSSWLEWGLKSFPFIKYRHVCVYNVCL